MNQERIPIREGLLSGPLTALHQVSLMGTHCTDCAETTLGTNSVCPNCGGRALQSGPLSLQGTLYTYTIVRHRPPGDYKGPQPFQPFALGLVELSQGLRVMAPIEGDLAAIKIGMPLKFRAFVRPDATASSEVVSFAFHV
jgi:uncharacterized protein